MTAPSGLFGRGGGGGAFPKIDDFEGKLILLKPSLVEQVQKYQGKPGEMQDRVTADVVVFEDDGTWDVTDDMYFSQVGIVNPCKRALKPNAQTRFILGRVSKVPSKQTKAMTPPLDTPEKVYAGLAEWRDAMAKGKKAVEPKFAWGLLDFTPEDEVLAMKYLQETSPIGSAEVA